MTNSPSELEQQLAAALGSGYTIEREITGGGMSRVFLAVEKSLDRHVVIKLLPPELAAGVNRERFQREVQLAAKLQHPHIVPLFAAGAVGDLLYYTMPFIAGESLKHALANGTKFGVRDTVRILHDVTDALAHAHAHGIVHRDIKPANVLRSGGHAVVTDFGVAKALNVSRPGTAMTASGMVVGTPAYMAPEQLAGDPAADHRVDIYAVGLLGYELLAGMNPFSSPSPQQTLASQLTRIPEQLNVRHPDVPPALATVIARCLAKAPEQRPQSASQLLAELDSLVSISGDTAISRRARLDTWTVGAIGLTVVVTGLVLAVLYGPAIRRKAQDAAPPSAPPAATLTHDDSVAITRAIEAKLAARRKPVDPPAATKSAAPVAAPAATPAAPTPAQTQAYSDSLRNAVMREVMDSVAKLRGLDAFPGLREMAGVNFAPGAFRGARGGRDSARVYRIQPPGVQAPGVPTEVTVDSAHSRPNPLSQAAFQERAANMGPARRVFVAYPRVGRTNAAARDAALKLRDTLVWQLSLDPRFVVLPVDSTVQVSSSARLSETDAERLKADMAMVVVAIPTGNGRAQWQVVNRDLTAQPAYQQRVSWADVRLDSLTRGTDSLVRNAVRSLREMDRAPRRGMATGMIGHDAAGH
ncbi:MAG TPA: serine/threonine-protein kinase [Gemmatimonadales bacterium]